MESAVKVFKFEGDNDSFLGQARPATMSIPQGKFIAHTEIANVGYVWASGETEDEAMANLRKELPVESRRGFKALKDKLMSLKVCDKLSFSEKHNMFIFKRNYVVHNGATAESYKDVVLAALTTEGLEFRNVTAEDHFVGHLRKGSNFSVSCQIAPAPGTILEEKPPKAKKEKRQKKVTLGKNGKKTVETPDQAPDVGNLQKAA